MGIKSNDGTKHLLSRIVFAVLIFLLFYYASASIVSLIDNSSFKYNRFLRRNDTELRILISLLLTFLFVYQSLKRGNCTGTGRDWVIIIGLSFLLSGFLALLANATNFWFMHYLIGFLVGVIGFLVTKKSRNRYVGELSGLIGVISLLVGGQFEYLMSMDPGDYPSVLYIRSFANPAIWAISLLFVFFSAYFLAKGALIKKIAS